MLVADLWSVVITMFLLQKRIFWLVLSVIVILSISAEAHAANAVKIMPLGDSITKGTGSAYAWGYREPLYVSLINGGYSFDFVGSLTDGSFSDPNHEGHYGWRADEILNGRPSDPAAGNLTNWLPAGQPDVILLHIGTNDITAGNQDANEVNSILNIIDAYEVTSGKNIPVVLALIINRASYSSATTIYNNDLNTMATRRISNGDNIVIVNMENALNYSTDMADGVHPNDNGYVKIANIWYGALADYFDSLTLVISGYVLEADDNAPVEGVLIQADGNAVAAETDANGYYEFWVDRGWSSVVAAQKDGYVFEPNSIAYSDVNQNYTDMNYTTTLLTFKISGFVFEQDSVTPISNVNIDANNGGGATLTDANGCYEIIVDYNWSGDVTAGKYAYSFEPNSRHYEFVNHNFIADQNFTGNEYDFKITGFIKNQCNVPVEGVSDRCRQWRQRGYN